MHKIALHTSFNETCRRCPRWIDPTVYMPQPIKPVVGVLDNCIPIMQYIRLAALVHKGQSGIGNSFEFQRVSPDSHSTDYIIYQMLVWFLGYTLYHQSLIEPTMLLNCSSEVVGLTGLGCIITDGISWSGCRLT